MELIKITDPQEMSPGLSNTFEKAIGELNGALDKFRQAQIAELKHQISYMQDNILKSGIKDYGITDPLSNIEALVYQLFHDKKR